MPDRYQETMDKALQCIHLARAINDAYPDPTKIPGEKVRERKALLTEAGRLREIADAEKQQGDLESWAASPGEDAAPIAAAAHKAGVEAKLSGGTDRFAEANHEISVKRFAKALRLGVGSLNAEEKAAIIEDSTGQIIVPHDLAGPIFLTLPRLGVLRPLALTRNTTSNLVDVRALTGVTAGWGQIEITNAGGATPPTDAAIAATGPNTVTVQDLVALAKIGTDELADTDANLVQLVQQIIGEKFAEMEDDAFAAGNGTSKPWGLATRATNTAIVPAAQGVTAAAAQTVTMDDIKKMPFLILSRFAANGAYLASDDATQAIVLLKDSTSNYLWQPSNQAGQPDRLNGYPFYRVSGLPSMAATTTAVDPAVLFGDVGSGYLIAQRQQITVQRLDERYADQGLVGFLFKQRVGGDVIRGAAFSKYLL
jgi:HK97 family phage major capsid protein